MSEKPRKPLDEALYGMFYDVTKAIGLSLNPEQNEKLRARCERLATLFEKVMRDTTVQFAEQLQKATKKGFSKTDEVFDTIHGRLEKADKCISSLQGQLTELSKLYTEVSNSQSEDSESKPTGSSVQEASDVGPTQPEQTEPVDVESETSPSSTTKVGQLQGEPFSYQVPTKTTDGSKIEPGEGI